MVQLSLPGVGIRAAILWIVGEPENAPTKGRTEGFRKVAISYSLNALVLNLFSHFEEYF